MLNRALITRRRMCGALLAGPFALSSIPGARGEQPEAFHLDYLLASSMFGTISLAEILPACRAMGTQLIDIWPRVHGNQWEQIVAMGDEAFEALLSEHKVRVGMLTRFDLGAFGLQEIMPWMKRFGTTRVVTGCFQQQSGLQGSELKVAVRKFVEQMKPHVAAAEEAGVTIAVENHAGSLISSSDAIRYLAEFSSSENLGIALAPYHLPQDARLIARLIEDIGPKMVHFYAWQHGDGCIAGLTKQEELKQLPGNGPLDFRPILAAMKKTKYQGGTEIFMHPTPRGIPIMKDLEGSSQVINRARDYLAKCLAEI